MTEALHDALTTIHGVGDAKADQILDVLDNHNATTDDQDAVDVDELLGTIPPGKGRQAARQYLEDHGHV